MPACAVRVCGNRSSVSNFKTCGVTYHIFPKDPNQKEKWIDACGRKDDWFPSKLAVMCSSHFEEECFKPLKKSRRLFPGSVPTLNLRLVFDSPSKTSKNKLSTKKTIIKPATKKSILRRYKVKVKKYKRALQEHKHVISTIYRRFRRSNKNTEMLKNILDTLKIENAVREDHLWLLDSVSVVFAPSHRSL